MNPFNIQEALKSPERVITRYNREVTDLHFCEDSSQYYSYPLIAVIDGKIIFFTKEGKFNPPHDHPLDLFLTPITQTGWINIYKTDGEYYGKKIHPTEEIAKQAKDNPLTKGGEYINTILIQY